ncbi:MAG: amino acid ABC transporter substrate-binding protein [Deltaproteobacteria bacterium]|nr:MAG: amino acid ABC transporter substrate-binding protein [Deltaproteobacteria bacterium]
MKRAKSLSVIIWLALVLVMLPFASKSAKAASAPEIIKIGGALPLTGRFAAGGKELKDGYELALKNINAAGGVYVKEFGKKIPIEIIMLDDESDPTKTVSRLEKLYSVDKVVAYVGGYGSGLNAAAAPVAEKNKVPIVAVAFSLLTPHKQGYKYLFSPFVKTDRGVAICFDLLDSLPKGKKPTRVAIFAEKTGWGKELGHYVTQDAKKRGYSVVTHENYARTAKDFSAIILAAKSADAEVVLGVPTPPAAIAIAKQMKELDYNPRALFFWRGAGAAAWPKNLGKDGDYASYMTNWDYNFGYPGCKELVAAFQAKAGRLPACSVGYGYAVVEVVADAIERAGTLDRAKIRDAIASTTNLMTVQGPIERFREDGVGICPPAIMQWQKGVSQVVYHEEFITAPFVYPMPKWSER